MEETNAMQQPIRHFVKICAKHLPIKQPIVEFGALQVSGDAKEDLRTLFPGFEYTGADMQSGPGVDKVLDLHSIDLPSESVGCVLSLDTLEHVEYPRKAVEEIHRILDPDGIVVISSVFEFPIHSYPNDYWRFTPEGFKSLLQVFDSHLVFSFGQSEDRPLCVTGVGFKGARPNTSEFIEDCSNWSRWHSAILETMAAKNKKT